MATLNVQKSLDEFYENIYKARSSFETVLNMQLCNISEGDISDEEDVVEYYIKSAYYQLLALSEALGLDHFHSLIVKLADEIEGGGKKWIHSRMGREEPYLVWPSKFQYFANAIKAMYAVPSIGVVPRDLEQILRNTLYAITDKDCFVSSPANEDDVHRRIEAVLKCIFPDLLHKPTLNKPIKCFEPDTGLPTIRTLIEYKYLTSKLDCARIADEVLADTRGYASADWDKFIYVIYETRRVRSEGDWEGLLRAAEVPHNTTVIVLTGEEASGGKPPPSKKGTPRKPKTKSG